MAIHVKQIIRKFVGDRSYYSWRARYNVRKFERQAKPHLFVHQMGKVGSSSVVHSLKAAEIEKKMVLHWTHFLSDQGLDFLEKLYGEGYGGWSQFPTNIKAHLQRSRALNQGIRRWQQAGQRSKVITLIRDPLRVNLSGFFQNYTWWPKKLLGQSQQRTPGYLEALTEQFFRAYPHKVPLVWFDQEIKDVFGIDVFAQPFDPIQGYQHYHGQYADLLVIKLEALDRCGKAAISNFLGLDNFVLQKANVADDKWYAALYKEFVEQITIPPAYLEQIYGAKLATHFYSAEELTQFRAKWLVTVEK